jgi:hypothetical protein
METQMWNAQFIQYQQILEKYFLKFQYNISY